MILDPVNAIGRIMAAGITADDFYFKNYGYMYDAIIKTSEKNAGKDFGIVEVGEVLKAAGHFEMIGGYAELSKIEDEAVTKAGFPGLITTLKDYSKRRQIRRKLIEYDRKLQDNDDDINEVMDDMKSDFIKETHKIQEVKNCSIKDAVQEEALNAAMIADNTRVNYKVFFGLNNVDNMQLNIGNGQLVVIGARPYVGKTTLTLNLAYKLARYDGIGGVFFSIDDAQRSSAQRLLSHVGQIPFDKLQNPEYLQAEDMVLMQDAIKQIETIDDLLIFDYRKTITPSAIRVKLLEEKQKNPAIKNFFIDHINKLRSNEGKRFQSRDREVGDIIQEVKSIAQSLDMTCFALCQINRDFTRNSQGGDEPEMHHLKESGDIEQEADVVLLLWTNKENFLSNQGTINVKVAKNKNGKPGYAQVIFDKPYQTFRDNM